MDLNRLTRDADDLIRKVVSRYNQLYVPSGAISQVELDLLLDDLRNLYDTFKTIGQENLSRKNTIERPQVSVETHTSQDTAFAQQEEEFEIEKPATAEPVNSRHTPEPEAEPVRPVNPEPAAEIAATATQNQDYSYAANETPTELQPSASPETAEPQPEFTETPKPVFEQTVQPATGEVAATPQQAAASTLAEKFNTPKSLSEVIASSQPSAGNGPRVLLQPIADLNTGIGLNDKFSFISELFGNNPAIYEEAITRINRAVNLDEANWILQKYHSHEWDHKHETHNRLKDFIKRRFI
jgi:hypothetical protein